MDAPDFWEPAFLVNPYDGLRALREAAPVWWEPRLGAWVLTGYDEVAAVLADPRFLAEPASVCCPGTPEPVLRVLTGLPPDFHPPRVPWAGLAATMVNALPPGPAEIVGGVAEPVVTHGIAASTGRPVAEVRRVWAALPALVDLLGAGLCTSRHHEAAARSARVLGPTDAELVAWLLAVGEPTVGLIANTVVTLLRHPGQLALLHRRPELTGAAVCEAGRFGALTVSAARRATEERDLAGHHILRGELVHALVCAANRDPRHFPEPAVFDILRTPASPPLGPAADECVLHATTAVLDRLAPRLVRLADPAPGWRTNLLIRHATPLHAQLS